MEFKHYVKLCVLGHLMNVYVHELHVYYKDYIMTHNVFAGFCSAIGKWQIITHYGNQKESENHQLNTPVGTD
jgi:hypothetical protein